MHNETIKVSESQFGVGLKTLDREVAQLRRGPALRNKGKRRGNAEINKPMVLRIWSYVNGLKEAPHKDLIRQRVNTRIIQRIDKGSKYDLFVK